MVDGSAQNIKITSWEDFIFAENLLKQFKVQDSKSKV
jgi:2-C-methyl-D-erythritol 4-phosphate cytidylyltransferase